MTFPRSVKIMRISVDIDDDLLARAAACDGKGLKPEELIVQAIHAWVSLEERRRLAGLGGEAPQMPEVPRRRP